MFKTDIKKLKKKSSDIKESNKARLPLFSLTEDELDVIVNKPIKGQWEGFKFSELRDDYEGRRLLFWVVNGDFDKSIRQLAEEMLD